MTLAFTPDGKQVLAAGEETARFYDAATGKEIRKFYWSDKPVIRGIAFSGDGKRALTACHGGRVRLWDLARGTALRSFDAGIVYCVAISPDGKLVLAGGLNNPVRLWDATTGREIRKFQPDGDRVDCLAFSPNGKQMLIGGKTVLLCDIDGAKEPQLFEMAESPVSRITFSPDGKQVLIERWDACNLWEFGSGKLLRRFEGRTRAITFSPDSKQLLVMENSVGRLLDAKTAREIRRFAGRMSFGWSNAAFSPVGKVLVTADGLWNVDTGAQVWRFDNRSEP